MSTKRVYKVLQDIDLSQNSLLNTSKIINDYTNDSSIDISSNGYIHESSKNISLQSKNNDKEATLVLNDDTITSTASSVNVVTDNYVNTTANNISMGNINSVVDIKGLNSLEVTSKNDDNKSELKINNVVVDYVDSNDINTLNLKVNSELHVSSSKEENNGIKIYWDNNTNSLFFVKVD